MAANRFELRELVKTRWYVNKGDWGPAIVSRLPGPSSSYRVIMIYNNDRETPIYKTRHATELRKMDEVVEGYRQADEDILDDLKRVYDTELDNPNGFPPYIKGRRSRKTRKSKKTSRKSRRNR